MNISAIATKPDEDTISIDPFDDPVFIGNLKKTYESFRWVNLPRHRSNDGFGSSYMV